MSDLDPEPPSGQQHSLRSGDQEAVVTEVGATLREYRCGGRAVLEGFAEHDLCSGGRGQQLMPWPNRIGDGRYTFRGRDYQLDLSEPAKANAIHGLVRWANWTADRADESGLVMRHRLHAQSGYPFSLDLEVRYTLHAAGLTVETAVRNIGAQPAPFGCGAHPYLGVGTATIDSCSLRLPAATYLLSDDRQLPTGRAGVEGTFLDFRQGRPIGDTRLDTAFTELTRDSDGRARVELESPSGDKLALWVGSNYGWLMVYTGDTLEDPQQRRRGIAVEPMSCPPDAFRSGEDVVTLPAGGMASFEWGIDVAGLRR